MLAAQIGHPNPRLVFLQNADDLLFTKTLPLNLSGPSIKARANFNLD